MTTFPLPKNVTTRPLWRLGLGLAGLTLAGTAATVWQLHRTAAPVAPAAGTYSAAGYGGFVSAMPAAPAAVSGKAVAPAGGALGRTPTAAPLTAASSPALAALSQATKAYQAGQYAKVEQITSALPNLPKAAPLVPATPAEKTARLAQAKIRHLSAFALARRHDIVGARERFAQVRLEATPLHSAQLTQAAPALEVTGYRSPTLAEDAAYQHAVCTAALGNTNAAEAEWRQVMLDYPESPLVAACIKRIARLHKGDIPKDAEATWKQAMAIAQTRQKERDRLASLCGPAALAQALGTADSVDTLAREMHTSEQGTTLAALQAAARKHGYSEAQGAALTWPGLLQRANQGKLIALVSAQAYPAGHYLLVTAASDTGGVTVWDNNGAGPNQPARHTYTPEAWRKLWLRPTEIGQPTGMALLLQK